MSSVQTSSSHDPELELIGSGLKKRTELALGDEFLRKAVAFTTDKLKNGRLNAMADIGNWELWRDRASNIRTHTICHLDYYLTQFSDNVVNSGGHVYFCKTADDAVKQFIEIAEMKKARLVAKGKSMVSEEIHLNHHLEEIGIEAIETDLGEYILQLAKETPSHLIIPAIHKNKQQIADLFTEASGKELMPETKVLADYAKQKLRNYFLEADIGLTGCNFGVAESGSITLVSNEGNGRMVSTLPKTHVVVMGMERLIPTFEDLEVMLNMLARSATGQKLTTYTSLITGPRRPEDLDGPEELHVIILDNGRSSQLGDPVFQEVLNCIRCAACLNVCPVYRHIGGHAYGSVYSGPIGAVLTPLIQQDMKEAGQLSYASSLCGACYEACPVKIPLHDMLVQLRHRKVKMKLTPMAERIAFRTFQTAFGHVTLYKMAIKSAYYMQKPLLQEGKIKKGFGPLAGWTQSRFLPMKPKQSFRDKWEALQLEMKQKAKIDVGQTIKQDNKMETNANSHPARSSAVSGEELSAERSAYKKAAEERGGADE
ncbi:LutB/LldF family L-lactate oxidation iron-sulfur protein [Paenibacillus sp. GP183]|uniref:LutB/LldF family L-lactate oxidation iron-sulfur protein n=1 Tax=Paenibacillus sp. GP183 TaxID=1882751 RepID=UPI0008992948|nr:LutB/LldF family L-lactate oxidation iron-sulfur protein [Paenibacillus sp. GP183]SEB78720.1 L-lactate dehydrogenase complex protein LldF [Paenibacillus sp. GP183]